MSKRDYNLILDIGCHANVEAGKAIARVASYVPDELDQALVAIVAAHAMALKLQMMREMSPAVAVFIDFLDSQVDRAQMRADIERMKSQPLD